MADLQFRVGEMRNGEYGSDVRAFIYRSTISPVTIGA